MAFPGGISLPIDMMRETADRLDHSGDQLQDEIDQAVRAANQQSLNLPSQMYDQEQALESQFKMRLKDMLTARASIAQLLRGAADAATRFDTSGWRALEQ